VVEVAGDCGGNEGEERRGEERSGVEWSGVVGEQTDVPFYYPPFKGMASQCMKISRRLLGLLW
jgi:hypothetical protein